MFGLCVHSSPEKQCSMYYAYKTNGKGHRVGIKTLEMHMQKSTKQKVLSCGNSFQCLNSDAHIGKYLNKNREVKH